MHEPPHPGCIRHADSNALPVYTVSIRSLVDSRSAAARAERAAIAAGFGPRERRSVGIAVCELATNIARHATEGTIRIYTCGHGIKIVAEDRGPGIANIDAAWIDGHSKGQQLTGESSRREGLGCGLGAVRRLMDRVEIESCPMGTRVTAFKEAGGAHGQR